ncbi:ubiquitin-conjugating enzyme (macronuclear) [Tetrahymena thermophila SB210]|uniref:Ubiquitin-conjugating enzyme n=1 Tax=Tetrahymena thermophila (strain SB210) TaxID=312017 RepID=I7M018_TETTS|nr:ubiquitin-conjugating enzyme [Tetrahymena thermophila SB210]EAR85318.2 ubiquitin-conjugating enzyme [Tetrahymena thermophila SB210]|eukprot:XP_001032981.2 ubiquitin-conjugating enzyme [Tetrahymena thermophila SB210]
MNENIKQKRMMKEIEHLSKNPSEDYTASPLSNDLYTWHFTIRGPTETEFEEGIYHGKIMFPFNYPLEPPDIYFLNKSGRFEVNQKICLTITGFHAEQWNASWTMRTILEALISMFPEKEQVQSVGSIVHSNDVRKKLAKESWNFECEKCGPINKILKQRQKQPKEPQVNKNLGNSQAQNEQNVEETIEIAKEIDIEKEKQNLDNLEQKIQKLQQEKPKINTLQTNIQQKREPINLQNQSQVYQQERQYSFEQVAKNLEEVVNVINSIRIISNDSQTKEKEKANPKNEQSNPQKQNDSDQQKENQKNSDLKQKQDLGNQNQMSDQNKEKQQQQEPEEEEKQQQNQSREQNINELETNRLNNQDNKSQNEQDNINLNQENQKDLEESKLDQPNPQQKDQENSNPDNEQQVPQSEESKQEAIQKVKKLDALLLVTSIMFILYLTFLFQYNI